jgi:hypothetical protein
MNRDGRGQNTHVARTMPHSQPERQPEFKPAVDIFPPPNRLGRTHSMNGLPNLSSRRRFLRDSTHAAAWIVSGPATAFLATGCRTGASAPPRPPSLIAIHDVASGHYDILEGDRRVLRYNYATIHPGALLESISPGNRIYAVARSNYIHPLHGLEGEELTRDWSTDHPHHRGIYWAWPEVDWRGQRGDLHALQKVFARPTGRCLTRRGRGFAEIQAENRWLWEDREPIVHEIATIRAWSRQPFGRFIDLQFKFTALGEPVRIARRGTDAYGGLNLRFNSIEDQSIAKHTDPSDVRTRRAWAEIAGRFGGAAAPSGVVLFPHPNNPCHPGDWVDYPQLNWLQPTFPTQATRFELTPGRPLTLRYRLWIHAGGTASEADCSRLFDLWAHSR